MAQTITITMYAQEYIMDKAEFDRDQGNIKTTKLRVDEIKNLDQEEQKADYNGK